MEKHSNETLQNMKTIENYNYPFLWEIKYKPPIDAANIQCEVNLENYLLKYRFLSE